MRFVGVVVTSALVGALAGCGLGTQPEPSPSDPVAVGWPKGADELVLRIETRGGLLPPLERERQLPSIGIYGDGLVLAPAPVDASFPGPAGYELEVLRTATSLNVVVDQAGDEAIVAYRPLLPDEEGCPADS